MNGWQEKWDKERAKLKVVFFEKGITECELRLDGCWMNEALGFAHRHKRDWYKTRGNEKLLGHFQEVLLACNPCHDKIENEKQLTEIFFKNLRYEGKERVQMDDFWEARPLSLEEFKIQE